MGTTFLLVRHAEHALQGGMLAGRMPGVQLSARGREQAAALARWLGRWDIAAVQASPQHRAQATARPVAAELGLGVETVAALDEIDFGDWQGLDFDTLEDDPRWRHWNAERASARVPGGESMRAVQARIVSHLQRMCALHPDGALVLVSHADVIKAALLHVIGASLDAHGRIEVDPAGLSTVVLGDWGGKVVALNERVAA